jgi:transcriptional regulator with XRE-family HTH domain
MKILDTLKRAGVNAEEFAELCGVSRSMIYKWEDGGSPHKLRKDKVEKILSALQHACREKKLPLKTAKADRELAKKRSDELKSVVISSLKTLAKGA